MKKRYKIILLVCSIFIFGGCNKEIKQETTNIIYKEVEGQQDVLYNLENSLSQVNNFNFKGVITNDKENYEFKGKIIFNDTIENSVINITYKNFNFYVKDKKVYASFMYNNTNVIIKDSLDNFIEEITNALEQKGIESDVNKIHNFIKEGTLDNLKIEEIDLISVNKKEEKYEVEYKEYKLLLNNYYLIEKINYIKDKLQINIDLDYSDVSIKIPLGYNLLTLNIKDIKKLLKVNNLGELIK